MQLKIKNKLYLSFGLLSVSIALLWLFSSYNIFSLSNSSEAMIKDNYNTVVSCKYMSLALDEIKNLQTKKLFNPQNLWGKWMLENIRRVLESFFRNN